MWCTRTITIDLFKGLKKIVSVCRHSCRLPNSASRGVVFWLRIYPRIRSPNRNGSKCNVRNLCRTDFCKNPRKSASLPCPFYFFSLIPLPFLLLFALPLRLLSHPFFLSLSQTPFSHLLLPLPIYLTFLSYHPFSLLPSSLFFTFLPFLRLFSCDSISFLFFVPPSE